MNLTDIHHIFIIPDMVSLIKDYIPPGEKFYYDKTKCSYNEILVTIHEHFGYSDGTVFIDHIIKAFQTSDFTIMHNLVNDIQWLAFNGTLETIKSNLQWFKKNDQSTELI